MPPKSVTCFICNTEVLKAQTLARANGTRACRSHEGVTAEAEKLAADDQLRRAKAIEQGSRPPFINDESSSRRMSLQWEKEAAEHRAYIYSHCWTCDAEGLEGREFFAQVLIAMKRLELRREGNFLSMPGDIRKLMGGVRFLGAIKLADEVIDRAIVKHVTKRVRDIVQFLGVVLMCPECAEKHGFKKRLDDLMPKPTWEQMEAMAPVVAAIDPMLREMAEKKEGQS